MVVKHCSCLFDIFHSLVHASSFLTQIHDRSDEFRSYHDLRFYDRFLHIFNLRRIRQIGRIGKFDHLSVCLIHFVDNSGCCRHQIQVIFPFQTFLDDFQMQKPEETTSEPKP